MHIHLDQLLLTVQGVPPEVAAEAVRTLGPDLVRAIDARRSATNSAPAQPAPATLDAGTLRIPANPTAASLRQALASHLARQLI